MKARYADDRVGDWNDFYAGGEYERLAYIGSEAMPVLLERFFEQVGTPADVASVGCGPAATEFELGPRYPETEFYGYDIARAVVDDNTAHADAEGLDNLHFAVDSLPALTTDRQFDLVYCLATLYFVDDVEASVRALYDRVRPGGHLVFNYANRYTRAQFDREFDGNRRDLFARVIDGSNLLSYRRIEELLGREPRSYWKAVDADHLAFVDRTTPCVVLKKPESAET